MYWKSASNVFSSTFSIIFYVTNQTQRQQKTTDKYVTVKERWIVNQIFF